MPEPRPEVRDAMTAYEAEVAAIIAEAAPIAAAAAALHARLDTAIEQLRRDLKGDDSHAARRRRAYPFDGLPMPPGLAEGLRDLTIAVRASAGRVH